MDRLLQDSQTGAANRLRLERQLNTGGGQQSAAFILPIHLPFPILQQASRTHRDRHACFYRPSMFSQRFKGLIRVFSQMSAACEVRKK